MPRHRLLEWAAGRGGCGSYRVGAARTHSVRLAPMTNPLNTVHRRSQGVEAEAVSTT